MERRLHWCPAPQSDTLSLRRTARPLRRPPPAPRSPRSPGSRRRRPLPGREDTARLLRARILLLPRPFPPCSAWITWLLSLGDPAAMEVSPCGAGSPRTHGGRAGRAAPPRGAGLRPRGAPPSIAPPEPPPGAPTFARSPAAPRLEKSSLISPPPLFFIFFIFPSVFQFSPRREAARRKDTCWARSARRVPVHLSGSGSQGELKTSFQTSQTFPRRIAMEELNVGANGGLYL